MYEYSAKCTHVVDGDTMDFVLDLGFHMTKKIRVRLLGIDTPEIYGRDAKEEKEFGLEVKKFVENQLFTSSLIEPSVNVIVATEKTGSFGRWLANVTFENGESLVGRIKEYFPELRDTK